MTGWVQSHPQPGDVTRSHSEGPDLWTPNALSGMDVRGSGPGSNPVAGPASETGESSFQGEGASARSPGLLTAPSSSLCIAPSLSASAWCSPRHWGGWPLSQFRSPSDLER